MNINFWWLDRQTHRQTDKQTDTHTHINTMTRSGLGARQSKNFFRPHSNLFRCVWELPNQLKNRSWHRTDFCNVVSDFHRIGPLGQINLVVAMSVCFFVCLSPFHVLDFEAYFAPTSRSWRSNNFRDSESLFASAGKKWSQNWTFLRQKSLKKSKNI